MLTQVASIWEEQLGNKMEAAGAYLEILELDEAHMPAYEALERIYGETEAWSELVELYFRQAEKFDDAAFKVSIYQKMAKVFEENLGSPDDAFDVLKAAFNIDYANEDTSRELERLATQANKWGELLNEYNGIVRSIADKNEQAELWVKIGRWYGEHLNRVDYGLKSLEEALKLNANNINALREMAGFYRRAMNNVELAKTYAGLLDVFEIWNEVEIPVTGSNAAYSTFAGTPGDYYQLLRVASAAAKAANPNARIVTSPYSYFKDKEAGGGSSLPWFEGFAEAVSARGADAFDIFALNLYRNPHDLWDRMKGGVPDAAEAADRKGFRQRLDEIQCEIARLREQQALLVRLLSDKAALEPAMDKARWTALLRGAGVDDAAMARWHALFEQQAPAAHQAFLLSLGIDADEMEHIRSWARQIGV